MRPAKTQISLGIHPVWSVSSLSPWTNLGSLATHSVHSKDSDQIGQADLSLCWAHKSFYWFRHVTSQMFFVADFNRHLFKRAMFAWRPVRTTSGHCQLLPVSVCWWLDRNELWDNHQLLHYRWFPHLQGRLLQHLQWLLLQVSAVKLRKIWTPEKLTLIILKY